MKLNKSTPTHFSYCLRSGRSMDLTDYYQLHSYTDGVAQYYVYDANLMPASNFENWSGKARKEVKKYVRERFSEFNGIIKIDGYEIDLRKVAEE